MDILNLNFSFHLLPTFSKQEAKQALFVQHLLSSVQFGKW